MVIENKPYDPVVVMAVERVHDAENLVRSAIQQLKLAREDLRSIQARRGVEEVTPTCAACMGYGCFPCPECFSRGIPSKGKDNGSKQSME